MSTTQLTLWYNGVIEIEKGSLVNCPLMRKDYFRMNDPQYITIPLSKTGKNRGKYIAIVDSIDSNLADFNWTVAISLNTQYAKRLEIDENGKQKTIYLHREVMKQMLGHELEANVHIDHISGVGTDNRRENLRLATHAENMQNRGKSKVNKSGYKGVNWYQAGQKWLARIRVNGKQIYLGYFDDPEVAYAACCDARDKHHGKYANHGEIE